MSIPAEVRELVERFDRNVSDYKRGKYNETQVRREFIDPFFKALGWDVDNTKGYAEAYKEVVHEDAVKIGRATKAPDYSFRIGGVRKFFLEAKKPSVDIKHDTHPAYQLRRYAWSAKLPLSILTDFEEFAVYDCRIKPVKTDKAPVARVMYLTYQNYLEQWAELVDIFSPESIRRGSFDKWVETTKAKKGTAEVDNAFLQEIERWRDLLARNFALRNSLSQRQLNFAVQQTIDRLIFLRIAEDRGIERYGRLQELLVADNLYPRLFDLFQKADEKYNSGLFRFQAEKGRDNPDTLTPALTLDDKVLTDILRHLYYPDSPYEFSVLPSDILGQVYEQFLGQVICLTPKGQAKIEDKPEVKKAGGVYYTPTYIVDYIVRQTVGQLVAGKTPGQIGGKNPLHVLDPACGSGSFLLGAYQFLLDWHLDWYVNNNPDKQAQKKNAPIHPAPTTDPDIPNWRLTVGERKRILLTHIYGVDIDPQAAEVTKLSLLLKVLEDEQSVTKQLGLFQERVLPDLDQNIKCGNSLIGYDFYDGQQMDLGLFDEEEQYRINAFDWQAEFAEVMQAGGFDAVIGNPPYIRSQLLGEAQREYYRKTYDCATATYDIYVLFVEQSINLLANRGRCGFILPNKFFTTDYGEGLRRLLIQNHLLEAMVDFEDAQVFSGAGTYTTLLFISGMPVDIPQYARLGFAFREDRNFGLARVLSQEDFSFEPIYLSDDGSRWTLAVGKSGRLLIRLQETFPDFSVQKPHIFQGLKTSADKIYIVKIENQIDDECDITNGLGEQANIEKQILKPIVKGEHVQRYSTTENNNLFIIYPYRVNEYGNATLLDEGELKTTYPNTWEYLNKYRKILGARDKGKWSKRSDWYAYARSQNIGTFIGPKFLVPYMTTRLRANFDVSGQTFFVNITTGGYGLRVQLGAHDTKYVLGILNSLLMNFCIWQMTNQFRGGYFAVNKQALERLPFRIINFSDPTDKANHDKMVSLVEQMLNLHQQLNQPQTPQAKTMLQRQIEATDRQIDKLVYQLYNLSEEEMKIVGGGE